MRIRLILSLCGCLFLVACERQSGGLDTRLGEEVYKDAVPVETLKLVPQDFQEQFQASGVVEAEDDVTVSSEIAERIVAVHREIGDRVAKGDLLLTLDTSAVDARIKKIEAQLARAKTQLKWARKDLDRQQALFETKVSAERALDEATRLADTSADDVAAAQAELELAMVDLARCRIASPIDGAIARRHVSPGEYVAPGIRLYDVVSSDRVKFVFSTAERDVIAVRKGESLTVEIDAYPGRAFSGVIRAISPAGSQETRTFRVEVNLESPNELSVLAGMSGRAQVIRARYEGVFLLPEEAVLRDGTASYVLLANDNHARRAEVQILSQVGAKAVISGALESEHDCIIVGQAAVSPGDEIRVRRNHDRIPELRFD